VRIDLKPIEPFVHQRLIATEASLCLDAAMIQQRLLKNGLATEGTATLRITGAGSTASNLE
jgi:hypothetical protein